MPNLHQPGKHGEDGYILITVLFLVALVLIGLAVAAPRMAQSIQRDKEIELVHRGEQYKRAIKLYYRKFGAYPTSIDQLLNTNNIRFLRKRYTDPITGKDDWRLIHLGQAKVPPMGFFGQPLAGIPGAANIGTPVSGATGASGTAAGPASPFGTPSSSSAFGTVTVNTPDATSYSDESGSGSAGEDASSHPSVTITGASAAAPASSTPTGASSPGSSSIGGSSSPLGGVGAIVGVGIPSTKASLLDYKKQTHYNKWEFVYNPIEDQMRQAGMMGAGNGNVNGTNGTSGPTSTSPFGSSNTNSSPFSSSPSPFGSNSNSSMGGSTPTTGSNPQQ